MNREHPSRSHHHLTKSLAVLLMISAAVQAREGDPARTMTGQPAIHCLSDLDPLVAETHKASLKLRDDALRKTISKDTCWPSGIWGDNQR